MIKTYMLAGFFACILLTSFAGDAAELKVAVASNFKDTFKEIANQFEKQSNHEVVISSGATGKHFAQISNGAPFDLFIAADVKRPQLLDYRGVGISESRRPYAFGKLVLWSNLAGHSLSVENFKDVLESDQYNHLAIANPNHAPYGRAASEVLMSLGLWPTIKSKVVRGENIAQASHFVSSRSADLGFVSYSQVIQMAGRESGTFVLIPPELYQPIEQQLILIRESAAARELLEFMQSHTALEIIHKYGYDTPDVK